MVRTVLTILFFVNFLLAQETIDIDSSKGFDIKPNGSVVFKNKVLKDGKYRVNHLPVENTDMFITINNGKLHGHIRTYYRDDHLLEEGRYENGEPQGCFVKYYKTGKKYSEEYYKDGDLDGPSIEYYENGRVKSRAYYRDGHPGDFSTFHENGNKDVERRGKYNIYYNNNGKRKLMYFYDKELNEGLVVKYYANGRIMEEITYEDGKRVDPSLWHDEDGSGMRKVTRTLDVIYPFKDIEIYEYLLDKGTFWN